MIHMGGANQQSLRPMSGQGRQQRRRVNPAAECDQNPNIGEARQQVSQAGGEPLRAERVRGFYSGLSENTPNEEIRAERDARNSSRGIASS
jgi:hypothetical protein